MMPSSSVYFISYINISHAISAKVVGYIVSNSVYFLNECFSFIANLQIHNHKIQNLTFHKNIIFQYVQANLIFCLVSVAGAYFSTF